VNLNRKITEIMTAFAKVTKDHDLQTRTLTPCAERLYHFLLRSVPAGSPQEFLLEEFSNFAEYSTRHIRRSLDALLNADLVEVVRAYSGQAFKLIAYHPGQKPPDLPDLPDLDEGAIAPVENEEEERREKKIVDRKIPTPDEKAENGIEMSQKHPSNPHSFVRSDHRDYLKTANTLKNTIAPRENINRESAHLLDQVAEVIAPEPTNPQLQKKVLESAASVVTDAIELVRYRKRFGDSKIHNLPGLLIQAIRNHWHLRDAERARLQESDAPLRLTQIQPSDVAPQGFKEWFDLAQWTRLVKASRRRDDGVEVLNSSDQWEPWEGLAVAFPLPKLKELARMQGHPSCD
jgi:hypothetical protein